MINCGNCVLLQVGQCGNQLGLEIFNSLYSHYILSKAEQSSGAMERCSSNLRLHSMLLTCNAVMNSIFQRIFYKCFFAQQVKIQTTAAAKVADGLREQFAW